EERPVAFDAFEVVAAAVLELEVRPEEHVPDRAGHEDLARFGRLEDPGGEMHGDSGDVSVGEFAPTGVQADLEFEAHAPHRGPQPYGAFNRPRGIVEHG